MNEVNKTLYIPLYGKAYVSKKGIILKDKKAEEIWEAEAFELKGKSKSKWLAYFMGMRAAAFDSWVKQKKCRMQQFLHIGCGMDSRVVRIGEENCRWYDVDYEAVISERKKYYAEDEYYKMISADIRSSDWLKDIKKSKQAIIVMEGVSMYLEKDELKALFEMFAASFENIALLMDCYSLFAAKMSKRRNPVKDVGAIRVFGIDDPKSIQSGNLVYTKECEITPKEYIEELKGMEKLVFKKLYAGSFSRKLYKIYEFEKA